MSVAFILFSLAYSIVVIRILFGLIKSTWGIAAIILVSLGATLIFPMCPALGLQMFATFILSILVLPFRPSVRTIKAVIVCAPIISYSAMVYFIAVPLLDLAAMRRDFPLESLAERLKYENLSTRAVPAAVSQLSEGARLRLEHFEKQGNGSLRIHALRSLHDGTADDFVLARGFGPGRMLMPRRELIELPKVSPISFEKQPPKVGTNFQPNGSAGESAGHEIGGTTLASADLLNMHTGGLSDFFDPDRMGYIIDRNHVAGFQSHRFFQMPGTQGIAWSSGYRVHNPPPTSPPEAWRENWAIVRIELIGLLSHNQPTAYVSDHLPQLDELASYPTRELDEFEHSALARLWFEEDVVIDSQPNRIRMLGSLRAGDNCRKCHSVERGELLGALSYELLSE